MFHRAILNYSVKMAVFSIAILLCMSAFANEHGDKEALVYSTDAEELKWGPCPDIFPETCRIAVLHGDPAEKNTDIFFKIPPGTELVKHKHTSAERMVLVSGKMQVHYDGHDKEVLTAGVYGFGPPELPHEAKCLEGDDPCILFIAFNKPIDVFPVEQDSEK